MSRFIDKLFFPNPAGIGARGHHFQHHLYVHSDFPNADTQKVFANKIKQFQACIDPRGHHFQHHL
jgi:hypothetical protein